MVSGITLTACSSQTANSPAENNAAAGGGQTNNSVNKESKSSASDDKSVQVFDGRTVDMPNKDGSPEEQAFVKAEVKKHDARIREKIPFDACNKDSEAAIVDIADGAFTKPGAKQKAYMYELCRPGRTFGIGGYIIAEDGKAVAHFAYGENGLNSNMFVLPDINQNGLSELVIYGGSMNQGYAGGAIEFYEAKNGNLEFLGSTITYTSDAGAKENGSTTAYFITVKPGSKPVFTRDTYEQKGDASKWSETKKAELFELDKKQAPKIAKIALDGDKGEAGKEVSSVKGATPPDVDTEVWNGDIWQVHNPPSNVRVAPDGKVLCTIAKKTKINLRGTSNIKDKNGEWLYTDACGKIGFIHSSQVQMEDGVPAG